MHTRESAGPTGEDDARDHVAQGPIRVVVVVPAYNAEAHLREVLSAAQRAGPDGAVVAVDAGSTDATARIAEELGARVIRLPKRAGPAEARNAGAREASAEVILFIDSDCVAHPDVVERVRSAFAEDPELVSLTGSYDAFPREPGFFSQYMNLRHHFTHQVAQREPATFWAGCGAVRRDAFLRLGGFDAERYPSPQIEDIELGMRLARLGKTRLDPQLNVTHLKRWTGRSVVATDVRRRAVPWARLILESGEVPNDLNLRSSQLRHCGLSSTIQKRSGCSRSQTRSAPVTMSANIATMTAWVPHSAVVNGSIPSTPRMSGTR